MDRSLRSTFIALLFCERITSLYHKRVGRINDSLLLWCVYRVALLEFFTSGACCQPNCNLKRLRDRDHNNYVSEGSFQSLSAVYVEEGEALLLDFLSYCLKIGGKELYCSFLQNLVTYFTAVCSAESNFVSIYILTDFLKMPSQNMEDLRGHENVFSQFHLWVSRSWRLASFESKLAVVSAMSNWLASLVLFESPQQILQQSHAFLVEPCTNVREMNDKLQHAFEGGTRDSISSNSCHLMDGFLDKNSNLSSILAVFNDSSSSKKYGDNTTGPQSVMINIACGMLLYQHNYLQLRSMDNARSCAENAVLIEHQFYQTGIIALSHLSCFQVYICTGNPEKAADSLTMGLQLLRQKREEVSGHMVSIFYLSAAQLFVYFFSAIGSALRLALQSEQRAVENTQQPPKERSKRVPHSAETVAQTVLHTLFISEIQSVYHPVPGSIWKECLLSIMRSTTLLQASIYGISTLPLALTGATMRLLLGEVAKASPITIMSCAELATVIPELTRHVAHTAIAIQEGTVVTQESPLVVLYNYVEGIKDIFGVENAARVEYNFFFRAVCTYVTASWLSQQGFILASYEKLDHLVQEIFFYSKTETSDKDSSTFQRNSRPGISGNTTMFYWHPDLLLIFAYTQKKKAELSCYLGYVDTLWEGKEQTSRIAAKCHFPYGVLISQYIEVLYFQKLHQYSRALDSALALHSSAAKIGFSILTKIVAAQIVTSFIHTGNYFTALNWLDEMNPVPQNLSLWYFCNRLNVLSECMIDKHCTKDFIDCMVSDALQALNSNIYSGADACLQFCRASHFSSLVDIVSILHSLSRLVGIANRSAHDNYNLPSTLHNLIIVLRQRHAIRGIFNGSFSLHDIMKKCCSGDILHFYT